MVAQKSRLPLGSQGRYEACRREAKGQGSKESGEGGAALGSEPDSGAHMKWCLSVSHHLGSTTRKPSVCLMFFLVYTGPSIGISFEDHNGYLNVCFVMRIL